MNKVSWRRKKVPTIGRKSRDLKREIARIRKAGTQKEKSGRPSHEKCILRGEKVARRRGKASRNPSNGKGCAERDISENLLADTCQEKENSSSGGGRKINPP